MKWELNDAVHLNFGYGSYRGRVVSVIGTGQSALVQLMRGYKDDCETIIEPGDRHEAVRIGKYEWVKGWFGKGKWEFVPCAGVGTE